MPVMSHTSSSSSVAARQVVIASSVFFVASSAFVVWFKRRARCRATKLVELANHLVRRGPLVDCSNVNVRAKILNAAMNRVLNFWHHIETSLEKAQPLSSQVGGLSTPQSGKKKKPLLFVPPDFVLKPLHTDERGFREIAFYESLRLSSGSHNELNVVRRVEMEYGRLPEMDQLAFASQSSKKNELEEIGDRVGIFDQVAMKLALLTNDEEVKKLDSLSRKAWRELRDEIESLHRLSKFTATYYGIVGQETSTSYEISADSYIMFDDLTANFSKPCVMDLKIGTKTYEDDAHYTKREREICKYKQQAYFGFRVTGMRVYDPSLSQELSEDGFLFFDKYYGRSLLTVEDVEKAFCTFFKTYNDPESLKLFNEELALSEGRDFEITELQKRWNVQTTVVRVGIIDEIIEQVSCIQEWFRNNHRFVFRSSSLLFVYEGDLMKGSSSNDNVVVKMIDFGHIQRSKNIDEGYLTGLNNLLDFLTRIRNNYSNSTK